MFLARRSERARVRDDHVRMDARFSPQATRSAYAPGQGIGSELLHRMLRELEGLYMIDLTVTPGCNRSMSAWE